MSFRVACRNLLISLLFALSTLTLVTANSRADEINHWPSLATDEDIVQFMLWNMKYVPNFLVGMREYDVDYFDILEKQHQINSKLANDPRLAPYLFSRPDRVQIDFESREQGAVAAPVKNVDPLAVANFKNDLQRVNETIPNNQRTLEGLKNRISEVAKIGWDLKLARLLSDLTKLLPKPRQGEVFRMPFEQKVKVLISEVSPVAIAGLDEKSRKLLGIESPSDIAPRVTALLERDRALSSLYSLLVISIAKSKSDPGLADGTIHFDANTVAMEQLAILGDKQKTFDLLKEVFTPGLANLGKDSLDDVRAVFKDAVGPTVKAETHSLIEMPTRISWASSCLGSECSTKRMSAYVNLPTLRRFFVDYSAEDGRGFVEVQLVESEGKRYLLVNKIQGPRIGGDLAVDALIAILQRTRDLGAEGIIVPTSEHWEIHTNFVEIRDRMRSLVAGKPETRYTYLDNPLREALRPLVIDSQYYTQDTRYQGVILTMEDLKSAHTVSSTIKKAPEFKLHETQISNGEAALNVFEIEETAGMTEVAQRMLHGLKISPEIYRSMKSVFLNDKRMSTSEYFESIANALRQTGYDVDATLVAKDRVSMLSPGLLRCPDAWSPKWQKKSLLAAYSLLQRQGTVDLVMSSTDTTSGRQLNVQNAKSLYDVLMRALEKRYLDRRAAGAILVGFKTDYDKVLPNLFELAEESNGDDIALNEIFREAYLRAPVQFKNEVIKGLQSEKNVIQVGALIAVDKSGIQDRDVIATLARIQNERNVTKSRYAYELSRKLTRRSSMVRCEAIFASH